MIDNINLGSVSGFSAGMAVRGSVGLAHEEVGRATSIKSEKSESGMAAVMSASSADGLPWSWKGPPMRSQPSVPPKVDPKASKRYLPPLSLAVLRNRSQLARACSCET
jgi:hypothetical protein